LAALIVFGEIIVNDHDCDMECW